MKVKVHNIGGVLAAETTYNKVYKYTMHVYYSIMYCKGIPLLEPEVTWEL